MALIIQKYDTHYKFKYVHHDLYTDNRSKLYVKGDGHQSS